MPADRLLVHHLQSLQSSDFPDPIRLCATATHLLTTLTNPLNLTLLTHHLLNSAALWSAQQRSHNLKDTLRFISIFQTASSRILQYEHEQRKREEQRIPPPPSSPDRPSLGGGLSREEWTRAIIKGVDDSSPVTRHHFVFAGLLIGFCGQDKQGVSGRLIARLEHAFVRAANLSLERINSSSQSEADGLTLALNYTFELLSDLERSRIAYDLLLPVLLRSTFDSPDGYQPAQFLGRVNPDIRALPDGRRSWPEQSSSFAQIQEMAQAPLVKTMGPLARLVAHTIENLNASWFVQIAMDDLISFTRLLEDQWRQCQLSAVFTAHEKQTFDSQTNEKTLPTLRRIFRSILFTITIILRGVMGRLLNDRALANDKVAPAIAAQTLHILSHLHFILTHHATPKAFSQYTFASLTALDILAAYPSSAHAFLTSIQPPRPSPESAQNPVDATRSLFFLNTSEHLVLALTADDIASLVLPLASDYLTPPSHTHELSAQIFESAHSVLLSILSAPQNAKIAAEHLPFYTDTLLSLFPHQIQPRQFRLAMKTLVRVSSPPSAVALVQPDLAATLLELLHWNVQHPEQWGQKPVLHNMVAPDEAGENPSPPTTLIVALIDCLPTLAPEMVEEWLSLTGELINLDTVGLGTQEREQCRSRFWECISTEMDVERAGICVGWWGSGGVRELVLGVGGHTGGGYEMSSGLPVGEGVESKL